MLIPECPVEGCSGLLGPGCWASPPDPLYHRCKSNHEFCQRFWDLIIEEAE